LVEIQMTRLWFGIVLFNIEDNLYNFTHAICPKRSERRRCTVQVSTEMQMSWVVGSVSALYITQVLLRLRERPVAGCRSSLLYLDNFDVKINLTID